MHRDLSELELKPASTRRAQQAECDRWMVDFNHVRPHEALGNKTPSEIYRDSKVRSVEPRVPTYPPEWTSRRVGKLGSIRVNGDVAFIGTALAGQVVGLKHKSGLRWQVHFFEVDLGEIEIASLHAVFETEAGVDALNAIRQQNERALRRVDKAVNRVRTWQRRLLARAFGRPNSAKRSAHKSSLNG